MKQHRDLVAPDLEVRHEFEVLLLLVHPHHLEFFPKESLEFLLEAEGEGEPPHVA